MKRSVPEFAPLLRIRRPEALQDFINEFRPKRGSSRFVCNSAKRVLQRGSANCIEGALVAAAWFALNGRRPMLLDLRTTEEDVSHVIAVFKRGSHWGAISRSNHASLRYREPVYSNPRELAMSFFHEYFNAKGAKTLRAYGRPFDLRLRGDAWAVGDGNLQELVNAIDEAPHNAVITSTQASQLRIADVVERRAGRLVQTRSR